MQRSRDDSSGAQGGGASTSNSISYSTPTKPKRKPLVNPYLKKNYAASATVVSAPSSAAATPTNTRSARTPVRNPYLKRAAASASLASDGHNNSSSAKRTLDFASQEEEDSAAAITPPFKRKHDENALHHDAATLASSRSVAIDLTSEFSSTLAASRSSCQPSPTIDSNKTYTLYFDGGSRGNPGIAGAGMVLYENNGIKNSLGKEIWNGKEFLGNHTTNNVAEYKALLTGLICAKSLGITKLHARGDSKLVVNQVCGKWHCKKDHLRHLLQQVIDVVRQFVSFDISHIYREDNKRADELANVAMNNQKTDLGGAVAGGVVELFKTPPVSQEEEKEGGDNALTAGPSVAEEELCDLVMTQSTISGENENNDCWSSNLSFLVQFELARFSLRNNLGASDFGSQLKTVFDANKGKTTLTRELIITIYNETEGGDSTAPYDDFLTRCSNNGHAVDEGNSNLFLFHAKLSQAGTELLPPEPAEVKTRRIHRRYGSHRFLDLRCDQKCAKSPVEFRKLLNKHLGRDKKLKIAGRQYGFLYSCPSEKKVIFRLFAESGIGIRGCDEMSASQVGASCIPPSLNPNLSLTSYMKRMQLSFTTTIPSIVLQPGMLEMIPDIQADGDNNENIMTDGCGLISREALNKVYTQYTCSLEERNVYLGKSNAISHSEASCPYSSFQGRIGGIKGMFVVDDRLDGVKIQYRPSQLKYDVPMTKQGIAAMAVGHDDILYHAVEVKEWDRPRQHAHLSQSAIQLLERRGVPPEYFLKLAEKEINELNSVRDNYELLMQKYKATKYLHDSTSLFEDDLLMRMLHANVPLDEPLMISKVDDFINEELRCYKEKSKFPVSQSRYLRMLPDHTGLLKHNEVFVSVGNDEGEQYNMARVGGIVAMRHPSYFESDLRKLKTVPAIDLLRRSPEKGKFFIGIISAIVFSIRGTRSEADKMSGGDFDGDTAWCCWDEEIVSKVSECSDQNIQSFQSPKDPFKERRMVYTDPQWTDMIINYTMQHRNDKNHLGILAKTLEMMRDSPMFNSAQVNKIAIKAFIQVDNPHTSQLTESDKLVFEEKPKPHWFASSQGGNKYTSHKVLGRLYDMFLDAGKQAIDFSRDMEETMNTHIREKVQKACEKNPKRVDAIREDMLSHLLRCNKAMQQIISSRDQDDEVETRLKRKGFIDLYSQHRLAIENNYEEEELPEVFTILYEQTYIKSRYRVTSTRYPGKKPYTFAWEVAHDHLTRIIADGEAKRNGGIGSLAPTVSRGNARLIFGKRR